MATLIPNSFQHPNILIDKLDYFLTPEESKVLAKAVREILGWEDKIPERKAPISLTVFVEGKFKKGKRVAYGCGIGLQAVRVALANLNKFNVLIKVGLPTQEGQWYWLQDDETQIDWAGLKARRAQWDADNARRTRKATKKSLQRRGVTSDVRGNVGRKGGVTSDVSEGVTSDVNKETQIETQIETQKGGDASHPPTLASSRANSHDPTDLPETEPQQVVLFPAMAQQAETGIQQLKRAGWNIRSADHFQAMAYFLEASRLPVPFDKSARKDWLGKVGEHLQIYGLEALRELYPRIIAQMRGDGLTVSRPGSVTNNLASYWAEHKNGGKDGSHRRVRGRDEKQGAGKLTPEQRKVFGGT